MWNRSEDKIRLIFIRHGATSSNKEHRYLGKSDESLSDEGKTELLNKKAEKKYPEVSFVFASPMKRCLETAQLLYPEAEVIEVLEWEEMDFGEFEGKNYLELKDDVRYQKWIDSKGTLPFPRGESREEFICRCEKGLSKIHKYLFQREGQIPDEIGIVVHGGTIMAILSSLCEGEYFDYQVGNGEGYKCICSIAKDSFKAIELERL